MSSENSPDGLQVRYCGGCNPFIDRVAVADAVRTELMGDCAAADVVRAELVGDGASARGADALGQPRTLYLSGCPRACASERRRSIEEDTAAVVVAGEHVDAAPTPAAQIADTVIRKLTSPTAPPPADHDTGDDHHPNVADKR